MEKSLIQTVRKLRVRGTKQLQISRRFYSSHYFPHKETTWYLLDLGWSKGNKAAYFDGTQSPQLDIDLFCEYLESADLERHRANIASLIEDLKGFTKIYTVATLVTAASALLVFWFTLLMGVVAGTLTAGFVASIALLVALIIFEN